MIRFQQSVFIRPQTIIWKVKNYRRLEQSEDKSKRIQADSCGSNKRAIQVLARNFDAVDLTTKQTQGGLDGDNGKLSGRCKTNRRTDNISVGVTRPRDVLNIRGNPSKQPVVG